MTDKLKIGDRVRLKNFERVYFVVEVDPPGCEPLAPSTYTVRISPTLETRSDLGLYGNALLELVRA